MRNGELLSVGDFAKMTRTTPQTLHHYDKLGLLSPVSRGENKYRFYSIKQMELCNSIRFLQKSGIKLSEINSLKDRRTPEIAAKVLERQIEELEDSAKKLDRARRLLETMLKSIKSGMDADEETISIQALPAERIILGDLNDYSGGRTDYDALFDFYQAMQKKCLDSEYELQYPVWGICSAERVLKEEWHYPDRYYFYNPSGADQRPAATYAVGYMRGGYGRHSELYRRMIAHIYQSGFEICGDTYVEYPHNEICTTDDSNYLLRLMITVREK